MKNKNYNNDINISDSYSKGLISGKVTATAGIRNPHNLEMVYGIGANRIEVLRALEKQNRFNIIWYITFFILGGICLVLEPKSWFFVLDLFILLFNLDLVSKGKLSGVYIGILECFIYCYICFISGLYGEVIKMLVINVPLNIFTIITWTRNLKSQNKTSYKNNEKKENTVTVRKLSIKNIWWLALIFIAIYVGCYFGLWALNTSALIFSAFCLAMTIFQKIFSALRYKENWFFSIANYTIGIAMWLQVLIESSSAGLNLIELPAVISNFACISNAIYGYFLWKSMYRKIAVNGGEVLSVRKVNIKKIIKLRRIYRELVWNKKIDINKNL